VLTTAHGQPVVIDGGKAGILIELNAQTGKLLWKLRRDSVQNAAVGRDERACCHRR
jgi:outer membrane protein assembly factor BamB